MFRAGYILLAVIASGCKMFVPIVQDSRGNVKPVGVAESPSAAVFAEHIDIKYDHYVIDLEVINKLDVPIYFNPSEVCYFAANTRFDPVNSDAIDDSWQHSRTQPALTRARNHDAVLDLIESEYVLIRTQLGNQELSESWIASLANDATDALENLKWLPGEFFPSGTIDKKSSKRGKVFLPITPVPFKYIRLVVPVGSTDYIIDLKRRGAQGYPHEVSWPSYVARVN